MHIARRPHEEPAQHQAGAGNSLERPEVGAIRPRRFLKTKKGVFESFARVLAPIMPTLPQQIFRGVDFQAIAHFGPADDPGAVLLQHILEFAHGDGEGVLGNMDVPSLADQVIVVDQPSRILNQNLERPKGLRPQFQIDAVAEQPPGCQVNEEGT